jgi:DNA-binding PadR family transcriptional regulator
MTQSDRFLPLKPLVFHVLLALKDTDRHGYAIKKEVATRTGGTIDLEPGTLYRLMARLLKQGLIEESDRRPAPESDDERRRYYCITGLGRDVLAAEARRMHLLLADEAVQDLVSEGRG